MANRWGHQAGADPYNQFATPRDDKLGLAGECMLSGNSWTAKQTAAVCVRFAGIVFDVVGDRGS